MDSYLETAEVVIDMKGIALTNRLEVDSTRRGRAKSPDPGRLIAWLLAIVMCLGTGIATAAEVVDLRVGRHAEFTRVVFELDRPAGYRLERRISETGKAEIVVTLDALSQAETLAISKAQISVVELVPQLNSSIAHIGLNGAGLRIKEMILASPPRIVLDVIAPKKPAASVPVEAASAKPIAKEAKRPAPAPAVPAAAKAPAAAAPAKKKTQPVAKAAEPVKAIPGSRAPTKKLSEAKAPAPASPAARPAAPIPDPPAANRASELAARTPAPPIRKKSAAKPAAVPSQPASIPQPDEPSLLNATTLGGGLALLGLVGGGAFVIMRRRANAEPMDLADFDADPLAADNPFAELGEDLGGAGAETTSVGDDEMPAFGAASSEAVDEFAAFEDDGPQKNLFDTSAGQTGVDENEMTNALGTENAGSSNAGDNMESFGGDTTVVTDGMDTMAGMPNMGGDNSEVMRMMQEMERRMAGLESRLDEVTEAKERLERQVVAQTEELRVQRAAIARTQRALRNINRPEEEAPTEPALRQPDGGAGA